MTAPAASPVVPAATAPAQAGRLPAWALVPLAALVWWAGGHLWWLLDGLGGPGAGATALPLSASTLGLLVLGAGTGGVGAGLLGRATRSRPLGLAATGGGVALAVAVTLLQSLAAVRSAGAGSFAAEPVVLTGLSAVVVGAAVVGWLLGSSALLGRPGLGAALGALAGLAPSWLSGVVAALGGSPGEASSWAGAAVLAGALVAVAVRPPLRLLWWPPVVALAWLTGPALAAVVWLEPLLRPGAGLPGTLLDSLSGAWQVFGLAADPAVRDLTPWIAALVTALALSAALVARPRPAAAG
ncbi:MULTISPECIES: hypothetical protein [unclassified Blastococcus]